MTQSTTVEQIADAILYEGYILYPYRASALKNAQRWNFGLLYPPAFAAAQTGSDTATMICQALLRGESVNVTIRFLQLVRRETWEEAIPREITIEGPGKRSFLFPGREDRDQNGVVRKQERLEGEIEVGIEALRDGWSRVSLRISNTGSGELTGRDAAVLHSLVSTHAILHAPSGEFASSLDPPEKLSGADGQCTNSGLWPVLAGDSTRRDTMLASPIILYDYPQIASESAGALFDGTEIDEILSLRILTLTEDEKREMRATDPKVRRLLERTEALDPRDWMQMHGVMRDARGWEKAR
jgi:hypothetical protein